MSNKGQVISVNISEEKGTTKRPAPEIVLDDRGVAGDAHAGLWHRQVSMLGQESIDSFIAATGKQVGPGEFAENITLQGIDMARVAVLDRFRIGDVELELTQIGKKCHGDGCAIYREVGTCVMPKEGVFCRVISGGTIRAGDLIEWRPRPLAVRIITLSDRASAGEYEDRSGPRARAMIEEFFSDKRWHVDIRSIVLPDDAVRLREELTGALREDVDMIFTVGGTGLGPRDITPETVASVCEKMVPGVMENIRVKFGSAKPHALLSRGIAGMAGRTQLYALPGSVRAVEEYLGEILKTMEHAIFMMHGLDAH
jgi:molybdopterin adenylyltransferase